MNYYPFHIGDYVAHTAHLSIIEDCAYRRLLDAYYMTEAPLPADVKAVARLIRMRDHQGDVELVLGEFFYPTPDGWRHKRCDDELARMRDKQTKAKASAQASVAARQAAATAKKKSQIPDGAQQRQENPKASDERTLDEISANAQLALNERSANAQRTPSERSTGVELPTPTPTPTFNSVTNVTASAAGDHQPPAKLTEPGEIIFGYGLSLLVNAGTPEKQARSFLGSLRKAHGDTVLIDSLRNCARAKPLQPLEWLAAALPPPLTGDGPSAEGRKPNRQEALEARNREVGRRAAEKIRAQMAAEAAAQAQGASHAN